MQTPRPDVLRAWSALLVAHRHCTTLLDVELREAVAMGLDDYDVLLQVRRADGPLRMSDLAARVLISRPTTTRVVDRLVQRGWLVRAAAAGDRRVVTVALTAEGRRAQGRAARVHLDGLHRLVGEPLEGHDVVALAAALEALGGASSPLG